VLGGYYLNIEPDRRRAGALWPDHRYVQKSSNCPRGEMVTETVEGRERYSVNVRYPRDFRDDPRAIGQPGVRHTRRRGYSAGTGREGQHRSSGRPRSAPRTRKLVDYIYVDLQGRDLGGYVGGRAKEVQDKSDCRPVSRRMERSVEYLERCRRTAANRYPGNVF